MLNIEATGYQPPETASTASVRSANSNEPPNFRKQTPPGRPHHQNRLPLLIVYAWAMEIVGVGCGVLNAGYTTFGDKLPDRVWGYVGATPMIVLAVAELGRVPLASAFFYRGKVIRCLCLLAILALSYLAIENWTIGFERLFSMRLNEVMAAASAVARADADRLALDSENNQEANAQKRAELRAGVKTREASIAALADQVRAASEAHGQNLVNIGQQCKLVRVSCIKPRSELEDRRYEAEVAQLNGMKAKEEQEKIGRQAEIEKLVQSDAHDAETIAQKRAAAAALLNARREEFRRVADNNPIYRVAASWFRATQLTPAQFATTRWWFATISAVAVALAGSVAAFVHYARPVLPGSSSILEIQMARLTRTLRAYIARKRKAVIREVPVFRDGKEFIFREGKEIVVKEVVRYVDRIVLIPRWGTGLVNYINSLWHYPRSRPVQDQPANDNNVTSVDKKVQ
jgi:hypothetical protein